MVEQLRAMRVQIPDFSHLTSTSRMAAHVAANVDDRFAQAAFNAVGASNEMQTALRATPEALMAEKQESARWSAVEDELRAMLEGVATANLNRRYRLGLTALQAYSISRQLVRQPEHAYLLPHVQEMRRHNRFGRRRRPAGPAPSEPVAMPQAKTSAAA
jgi:hypothetical protein